MRVQSKRRQLLAMAGLGWAGAGWGQTATVPAAAAAAAGPVLIGQSAHLTGPLAPTLMAVLRGQQLAIDQFNSRGGVGGRPVKLITLDDAYDARRCAENVDQLVNRDKVVALTGLAATGNIAAVLPMLAEKQVPLVGVYSGTPALRARQHPMFFTTLASYRDEVVQMVRTLKTLLRDQIVLVYQNAPFGHLMQPVVEEVAREQGAAVVAKVPLEANGSNAVAAAQAVAAANGKAVILMAFGPSIVPFVKAARAQAGVPIYAVSIANSKLAIEALGDDARGLAITQVIPSPWRAVEPLPRDFNAAMSKAGLTVDYDHYFGYVNMRVVLEALRRSGRNVSSASLVKTLESMQRVDLGGYTVAYGPQNHHGSHFVDITIIGPGGRFIR